MLQYIANNGIVNRRISLRLYIHYKRSSSSFLPITFFLPFLLITVISFTFSSTFNFVTVDATPNSESYVFLKKWGSQGTGEGQFVNPLAIAVDSTGNAIYVVDSGNNRIQEFDNNGTFITQWGSIGISNGQFNNPSGIAVDSNTGNVFVIDSGNNRIQKFDSSGNFITKWSINGTKDITNNRLPGVAVNPSGDVYQTGTGNSKVYKFSTDGLPLSSWGSNGISDNQFSFPTGIAIDRTGNIFILDSANHRIQKFDSNNNFIVKWGSQGPDDSQFKNPTGIATDLSGNVYVLDTGGINQVKKFNNNGNFITEFDSSDMLYGKFVSPSGIAVDSSGRVYVADTGNNRIEVFSKANSPPVAVAGLNQTTVDENTTVTLDGSKSYDPDGDTKSFSWKQLSGIPVTFLNNGNTSTPTFTAPHVINNASLKFSLTVTDDKGMVSNNTNNNTVAVTVKPVKIPTTTINNTSTSNKESLSITNKQQQEQPKLLSPTTFTNNTSNNKPPIADAGQPQEVSEGYIVLLNGTKSHDPDGDPITFSWRQIGGPAVKLDDATSDSPSIVSPSNIANYTKLTFQLTVKDDKGAKDSSTVTVTDKGVVPNMTSPILQPPSHLSDTSSTTNSDNSNKSKSFQLSITSQKLEPPVANAGQDQIVKAGDTVYLDGSKSYANNNGTLSKYYWSQFEGPTVYLNNADTATPSFIVPKVSNDTLLKFSLSVKDSKDVPSNIANVTVVVKPILFFALHMQ